MLTLLKTTVYLLRRGPCSAATGLPLSVLGLTAVVAAASQVLVGLTVVLLDVKKRAIVRVCRYVGSSFRDRLISFLNLLLYLINYLRQEKC